MLSMGVALFAKIALFLIDQTFVRHVGISFVNSHPKTQQ